MGREARGAGEHPSAESASYHHCQHLPSALQSASELGFIFTLLRTQGPELIKATGPEKCRPPVLVRRRHVCKPPWVRVVSSSTPTDYRAPSALLHPSYTTVNLPSYPRPAPILLHFPLYSAVCAYRPNSRAISPRCVLSFLASLELQDQEDIVLQLSSDCHTAVRMTPRVRVASSHAPSSRTHICSTTTTPLRVTSPRAFGLHLPSYIFTHFRCSSVTSTQAEQVAVIRAFTATATASSFSLLPPRKEDIRRGGPLLALAACRC